MFGAHQFYLGQSRRGAMWIGFSILCVGVAIVGYFYAFKDVGSVPLAMRAEALATAISRVQVIVGVTVFIFYVFLAIDLYRIPALVKIANAKWLRRPAQV